MIKINASYKEKETYKVKWEFYTPASSLYSNSNTISHLSIAHN